MPKNKKTTAPSQVDAPVTLSHETATDISRFLSYQFSKEPKQRFFNPQKDFIKAIEFLHRFEGWATKEDYYEELENIFSCAMQCDDGSQKASDYFFIIKQVKKLVESAFEFHKVFEYLNFTEIIGDVVLGDELDIKIAFAERENERLKSEYESLKNKI